MRELRANPLMTPAPHEVTKLLKDWSDGDQTALDRLMPLVYDELRRLAHQHMRQEKGPHEIVSATFLDRFLHLTRRLSRLSNLPETGLL